MYRYIQKLLKSLSLIAALSIQSTGSLQAEALIIASGEWPPLVSEFLPDEGPISLIVKESFAVNGVLIDIKYRPWKRTMREVESGQVDASFAWRKTISRKEALLFSDPIYSGSTVFFHLKSTPFKWNSFSDLSSYSLGTALGYAYSSEFEEARKNGVFNSFEAPGDINLLRMLLVGRIEVFPSNVDVIQYLMNKHYPDKLNQITYDPTPITTKPLYLVAKSGKLGAQTIDRFNRGLSTLKASGRFQEIYRQAGL